eukprot:TRINITY_DN780_c0_g2_i1.p1 TRINITY_DN780_c0_g2~~TRINITY_DN780_c0_g2_i1.p1  ORF type:complete len:242 (-),score=16.64 TRINITY_DN780_c0_g2_i1:366-1091(-)
MAELANSLGFGCVFNALADSQFPGIKDCLLPLLSKILGYAIIAASTIVKLPQIIIILRNKSIKGLSVSSFELEVVGFTIALAYCIFKQLPFSAYGELFFLLIQALTLIILIYHYSPSLGPPVWIKCALYCAVTPSLLAGRFDPVTYETLYACQHAVFFCSRLPQILSNFRNKSTGQLSYSTNLMSFGGCVVRLFTSIQEGAPGSMVLGSVLGFFTNGTVFLQILAYGNKSSVDTDSTKKSE